MLTNNVKNFHTVLSRNSFFNFHFNNQCTTSYIILFISKVKKNLFKIFLNNYAENNSKFSTFGVVFLSRMALRKSFMSPQPLHGSSCFHGKNLPKQKKDISLNLRRRTAQLEVTTEKTAQLPVSTFNPDSSRQPLWREAQWFPTPVNNKKRQEKDLTSINKPKTLLNDTPRFNKEQPMWEVYL